MCLGCRGVCEVRQPPTWEKGGVGVTSMAFCTIDFSPTPWGWKDVKKQKKHYFFCQVSGLSTWTIDDEIVQVPAGKGVWLPRGTKYSAEFSPDAVVCALGFREKDNPATAEAGVITIDQELEELLTQFSSPFTFRTNAAAERAKIMASVERLARTPHGLTLPQSPTARLVADELLREPGSPRTIEHWATWAHCSTRSLQRSFALETGRTFSEWRHACRMATAERQLRAGRSIASVGRLVGYTSHSSFTRAFRMHFGYPPSVGARRSSAA